MRQVELGPNCIDVSPVVRWEDFGRVIGELGLQVFPDRRLAILARF